jgi:hypothetical protein
MVKSMADVHLEQGRTEGALQTLREVLLRLLRKQFGRVPKAVERAVNATDDRARLGTWIDRVLTAATLDDVGIESPEESIGE